MNLHWSWLGKITLSGFKSQPKVALFKLFRKIEFCSYFMHFLTSQTFWGKIASHWRNMLKTVVSYVVLVGGLVLEIKHCKKMATILFFISYKNSLHFRFSLQFFLSICICQYILQLCHWGCTCKNNSSFKFQPKRCAFQAFSHSPTILNFAHISCIFSRGKHLKAKLPPIGEICSKTVVSYVVLVGSQEDIFTLDYISTSMHSS